MYGWFALGAALAVVGLVMNLLTQSDLVRTLSLGLLVVGFTAMTVGPVRTLIVALEDFFTHFLRLMEAILETPKSQDALPRGSQIPGDANATRLARLNRLASENKELIDALSKLVVPVLVALVPLSGFS